MAENNYLRSVTLHFQYYQQLAEKALAQVPDGQLGWQPTEESNSLMVIIKHMAGNLLSRFTDFLSSDGEKPWRDREKEFDEEPLTKEELIARWRQGWGILHQTLAELTGDDLNKLVYIRNQGHTVTEALNRQLAHYAYHVGQIVYLSRMIKGEGWQSLSIPRGQSEQFNREKFSQEPHREHFAQENLNPSDRDRK